VRFSRESLFDVELRPASVVTLYLLPSINRRLRPKLLRELRTGSRIVSNYFDMGDWRPDGRVEMRGRILLLWVVPAFAEGVWKCVLNHPAGRRHMTLRLRRRYQKIAGTARVGPGEVWVDEGKVIGDRLSFSFGDRSQGLTLRCDARVDGHVLRGTCRDGDREFAWAGRRQE
jgi:hypothetical protein